MSELKCIEYIVKIADEHSITRAAEKLYMTQSALNQQLLKLEEEIGHFGADGVCGRAQGVHVSVVGACGNKRAYSACAVLVSVAHN